MFIDFVLLIVGMALLIKGADFFVDGSSGVAKKFGVPSLIIGLTLVSLGTSAPEISISVNAVLAGSSDMSVGNVVGSNICNIFLILGLASIFTPLLISKDVKKYDIPIMVGLFILLIVFAYIITPNVIHWYEGLIMLVLFIGYTLFLIFRAKNEEQPKESNDKKTNMIKCIIFIILGLAAIVFGGDLVVDHARNIALELGMSETLVSLTIVAIGTSLPELVTSVVAGLKKEGDIAIGNVIGSCIFNILLILGLSSLISPFGPTHNLVVQSAVMLDVIIMLFGGVSLLVISCFSKKFDRWQGIIFLIIYISYVVYIIIRN